jgi:RNA-directed DNA polymerase
MGLRVEEERASERRAVIARIGGATSLHAKAGRLLSGLPSQENLINRLKEQRQMAEPNGTGAASDTQLDPAGENLSPQEKNVRRLQARIVKAIQEGRMGKARALQHLLTHSYSGRVMAVDRVTSNAGKKTPGVDGET